MSNIEIFGIAGKDEKSTLRVALAELEDIVSKSEKVEYK